MNKLVKIDSISNCVLQNSQVNALIFNFNETKKYYLHWKKHKDSVVFKYAKQRYDEMIEELENAFNDINISYFNKNKIAKLIK